MLLKQLIGDRKPVCSDWKRLARNWGIRSDYTLQNVCPDGVSCRICWDHNICCECLGEYPSACPRQCGDGTCGCGARSEEVKIELSNFSGNLHEAIKDHRRPLPEDKAIRSHLINHVSGMLVWYISNWFQDRVGRPVVPDSGKLLSALFEVLSETKYKDGLHLWRELNLKNLRVFDVCSPDADLIAVLHRTGEIWTSELNRIVSAWVKHKGIRVDLKPGQALLINGKVSFSATVNLVDNSLACYQVGGNGRVSWVDYDGVSPFVFTTMTALSDDESYGFVAECPFCHSNISESLYEVCNGTEDSLVLCPHCQNHVVFDSNAKPKTWFFSLHELASGGFLTKVMCFADITISSPSDMELTLELTQPQLQFIGYDYVFRGLFHEFREGIF